MASTVGNAEPFCACGRRWSECDRSRKNCCKKDAPAPAWRPPARVERWGEWSGPLQEIRTPVEGSHGWEIVQQEARGASGLYWRVSALHKNDEWHGHLPCMARGNYVPCHAASNLEERDREVSRLVRLIMEPMSGPKRDYTCGSCRLTERDGNTNRPAGKLCVYCRK